MVKIDLEKCFYGLNSIYVDLFFFFTNKGVNNVRIAIIMKIIDKGLLKKIR